MKKVLMPIGIVAVIAIMLMGYVVFNSQQLQVGDKNTDELERLERIKKIEEMQRTLNGADTSDSSTNTAESYSDSVQTSQLAVQEGREIKTVQLGTDTMIISLSLPSHLDAVVYQGTTNGEWAQIFINNSDTTMLSLYIEKPVGADGTSRCHLEFCLLQTVREIMTESRVWDYLGGSSYSDAGYSSEFPHIYKTVEGEYVVYLTGGPSDLATNKELDLYSVFNSLDFEIR